MSKIIINPSIMALIVLMISFFVFYNTFVYQVWQTTNLHWVSDVPIHAKFIEKFAHDGNFPVYTFWYRLVYIASGFSLSFNQIAYTSIVLLTGLVVSKYIITYHLLRNEISEKSVTALVSFMLIFTMPIISYWTQAQHTEQTLINNFHIYLGQVSPNQWHNSTLILAMPFNLLLFYYSIKHISSSKLYHFAIMGVLSIVSVLSKPNFALAFLPILLLTIFILNLKLREYLHAVIKTMIIAAPVFLTFLYQWYYTFVDNNLFVHNTKTVFQPFLVWNHYSPHIAISLILSIAFPLVVLALYFNKIDKYLKISWLTFILALGMMAFLAEYPGDSAGNYFWGAIAANYILFLFSAKLLLSQPLNWKAKVSFLIFGIHFLSGSFFIGSFFIEQTSLIM